MSNQRIAAVTVPRMFVGLVDDAGLFPPAQLAMPAALARYRHDREHDNAVLTGRFVCPAARLGELRVALGREEWLRLSVIATSTGDLAAAVEEIHADERIVLAGVELSPGATVDSPIADFIEVAAAGGTAVTAADIYTELSTGPDFAAGLDEIVRAGVSAKIRCGGIRAELFPSSGDLIRAVALLVQRCVRFKATAGLHHAVRYTDSTTGFTHHGFLNLLLAVSLAVQGADEAALREVIDSTDGAALAAAARAVDSDRAERVRGLFVSYGSCSTSEPVSDLTELQLLR